MNKQQWIETYVINIMSAYSALRYDHNCSFGWKDKEQFMGAEDAYLLAEQAYERVNVLKQSKKTEIKEQSQPKWISVDDAVPDFYKIVPVKLKRKNHVDLVMGYRTEASISTADKEGWIIMNKYWLNQEEITHWTPLPE